MTKLELRDALAGAVLKERHYTHTYNTALGRGLANAAYWKGYNAYTSGKGACNPYPSFSVLWRAFNNGFKKAGGVE